MRQWAELTNSRSRATHDTCIFGTVHNFFCGKHNYLQLVHLKPLDTRAILCACAWWVEDFNKDGIWCAAVCSSAQEAETHFYWRRGQFCSILYASEARDPTFPGTIWKSGWSLDIIAKPHPPNFNLHIISTPVTGWSLKCSRTHNMSISS